ncbi:MAG TPA: 30S ribosomal protein S2 [Ktedonobacterales bacterium]|jgi:small subunit ribosomal protein S2|nr:30S ribosomal protein S2 [Ktedonobacterales bacterium]
MAGNAATMRELLEAGVHFGHQTRRWNPKMRPFIFRAHNGIHIIDLQQTVQRLNEATRFITSLTSNGEYILFVGTKKQAQESIRDEAERSGQFFVNHRWLGGMLTNFQTIQLRIRYMKDLEARRENGEFDRLTKKEAQRLTDELERLDSTLGGIRNMRRLPAAIFVVDTRKEHTAVLEARRLEIPVIALADTNCDPDEMDYPIPSNDDAIRAVRLLCEKIADAALDGRRQYESQRERSEGAVRATAAPIALEEFGAEPGSEAAAASVEAPAATEAATPTSEATAETPSAPAAADEAAAPVSAEATPAEA